MFDPSSEMTLPTLVTVSVEFSFSPTVTVENRNQVHGRVPN